MSIGSGGALPRHLPLVVDEASSFRQRLLGLMFTAALAPGHGLVFRRCRSIHTCFMRYPIDVVYLDSRARVTKLVRQLGPWRMSSGPRETADTLELPAGSIEALSLEVGQALGLEAAA